MKYSLEIYIYKVKVIFKTNSKELKKRIEKDFSYFLKKEEIIKTFVIESLKEKIDWEKLPNIVAKKQSKNSITYDVESLRFNDYNGKLLSIYDYKRDFGVLYSECIEKLHEISYLLILSRVGKYHDLMGLHKIHAFSVISNGACLIGMADSGLGKSTLVAELLKDKSVQFLSDDTPLVDSFGNVKPFPLRLGVSSYESFGKIIDREKNCYTLQRDFYGEKKLLSIDGLENKVGEEYKKLILVNLKRFGGDDFICKKISKVKMLKALFKHMVIGIGLPMILEYFWEDGLCDFIKKSTIAMRRKLSALVLVMRADCYEIWLGRDIEKNRLGVVDLIKK